MYAKKELQCINASVMPAAQKGKKGKLLFRFRLLFFVFIIPFTVGCISDNTPKVSVSHSVEPFINFIAVDSVSKDRLMDGDKEFRFIGINAQDFYPVWMKGFPGWGYKYVDTDDFELEDIIKSASQMGATVIRYYALSAGDAKNGVEMHVMGPGMFSEAAFGRLDKIFELCGKYRVRLILGLVDYWDTVGGITTYANWRGKKKEDFFTDPQIMADFKLTIDYVTKRYKDEKALLCWETGNEFPINEDTDSWTRDISKYIKSKDPNHLVEDGQFGISPDSLSNPYIDIVNNHYYHWVQGSDYAAYCRSDKKLSKGKKVFLVEEFGYAGANLKIYHNLLDEAIKNGTSGVMIWALAHHNKKGGFYWHDGYDKTMGDYWTYHWPGFISGSTYNEIETLNLIRSHAYEIRGLNVPEMPVPDPPTLLAIDTVQSINWQGSAGASSYDVERATSITGPWELVGSDISDAVKGFNSLFNDTGAEAGVVYYYRVKAKNVSGTSEPSNVVGPVTSSK